MSILNVNQLQPVGGGNTITVGSSNIDYSGSITGNISVDGNLTVTGVVSHEDVTNIDSVGIITARRGIVSSGVVTATAFHGDGSQLTGIDVDATQIVTGNTSVQTVDTGSDGHVKVNTEGSERLRITSSGVKQVLNGNLNINQTYIDFSGDQSSTPQTAVALYRPADGTFAISTQNAERLRITSSGQLIVNGTENLAHPNMDDIIVGNAAGNRGITVVSGDAAFGTLAFGDSTDGSGNDRYQGFIEYYHSENSLRLGTVAQERFRISNIGHVITKGNNQGNPVGIEIRNNNTNGYSHAELSLTSQNATTSKIWCDVPNSGMRLNYNGGTSVKIDQSGNLVMGNGAGIDFSATANSSEVMSSELFDDYEEGTWTPTMGFATSYGTQSGKYVKVGKTVHIWFEVQVTAWSTYTGSTRITSRPFPIDKVTGCWAAVINATATTRDWRIGPWTAGGYGMAVWMENGQGSATSAGIRMSENTFSDYSSLTGSLGTNFTMKGGMTYISTT